MPCPYFRPESIDRQRHAARAPLGDLYSGSCDASGERSSSDHCNFGYGRGECPSFPLDSAADAVQWTHADADTTFYILERDYFPIGRQPAQDLPPGSPLRRQAEIFAAWRESLR